MLSQPFKLSNNSNITHNEIFYQQYNQRPRETWSFQWTCFTCKRTYFTWANFYQSSVDAVDRCVLSTNHCKSFSQSKFISISLFAIALYSCTQPVNVPSTTRNKPWNTLEPSVNDPWTTREPPGNHPWTTREPPVNHPWDQCVRDTKNWVRDPKLILYRERPVKHPWTTRETSVLETQKNWVRDPKNWFCTVSDPWNTREPPVRPVC